MSVCDIVNQFIGVSASSNIINEYQENIRVGTGRCNLFVKRFNNFCRKNLKGKYTINMMENLSSCDKENIHIELYFFRKVNNIFENSITFMLNDDNGDIIYASDYLTNCNGLPIEITIGNMYNKRQPDEFYMIIRENFLER